MTRLMIFVVILVVMAVVAIQNQEATALTILGSQQTPEIPFGLLLVGAFGAGSILTLFLYGLVGINQPPESKYRPMGRRVPYPDSPGSTDLPPSGPPTDTAAAPYATVGQSYGSSGAFVSEPTPQESGAPPQSNYQNSYQSDSQRSYSAAPSDTVSTSAFAPPIASEPSAEAYSETAVSDPKPEKKKSRFNPLNRQPKPAVEKKIGDDWGELRTAEHINSWDTDEVRRASGAAETDGRRGLFDFIGVGAAINGAASGPRSADSLTEDIAAGWHEPDGSYAYEESAYTGVGPYRDDLDSGWEQGYGGEDTASSAGASQRKIYSDGIYSDGDYSDSGYSEGPYEEGPYEALSEEDVEEGVYEADYRVIVPPSKPLDEVPLDQPTDEPNDGSKEPYT